MQVFHSLDNLVEKSAGLHILHPLVGHDIIEQLSLCGVLHYEVQLFGSFDYFVKLNDVSVSDHPQDLNFPSHSFNVSLVSNFGFF